MEMVNHPSSHHYPCARTLANPGQVLLQLSLIVRHCPSPKALSSSRCSRSCGTGASFCMWLRMKQPLCHPGGLSPPGSSGTIVLLLPAFCRTLEIPLKSNNSNSEDTKEKAISFKLHSAPWVLLTVTGTRLLFPFLLSEVHLSQEKCPKGSGRHLK